MSTLPILLSIIGGAPLHKNARLKGNNMRARLPRKSLFRKNENIFFSGQKSAISFVFHAFCGLLGLISIFCIFFGVCVRFFLSLAVEFVDVHRFGDNRDGVILNNGLAASYP